MSTVPPLLQKVGLLAGAFGSVLALVVGLGWLLLPHAAFQPGGGARAAALALPSLDDLDGPVAVAVIQGDLEGRFVLDRLESSDLADDRFRFTFSSPAFDSLMVNGRGVVGERITGDRLRVTFTLDGKNFFPDPAACTLQFARLTQTSPDRDAERTFVVVAGPRGAGTLTCAKVEAVRQEGLVVSLEAVFRLEPIETFPSRS